MTKSILCIAEGTTFAHIARTVVLHNALKQKGLTTYLAFDSQFDHLLNNPDHLQLKSIPSEQFIQKANQLKFSYTKQQIVDYVEDELELFERTQPQLVIGDYRLSLAISCRLKNIPYFNIVNGYWLPDYQKNCRLIPPFKYSFLPPSLNSWLYKTTFPLASKFVVSAYNRAAKHFGFFDLVGNSAKITTQATHRLVLEPQSWLHLSQKPASVTFTGPLNWEHDGIKPLWDVDIDSSIPTICISMGSSGDEGLLPQILSELADIRCNIILTGRKTEVAQMGQAKIYSAPFLNLKKYLKTSKLFISNGGSFSAVDAHQAGCPILGLPVNIDQHMSLDLIERNHVGKSIYGNTGKLKKYIHEYLNPSKEIQEQLNRAKSLFNKKPDISAVIDSINRYI